MKYPVLAAGLLGLCLAGSSAPAFAGNSNVEATIQNYGDLSMFYQGLLNTGVINELKENEHYTIFAPTNAAFAAQIHRDNYPCFYSDQCRPQTANVLRSHILVGTYDLKDLVTYGGGIQTASGKVVHVQSPYVGDYAVDGHKILSASEVAGNIVYRIDGVIATPQDLSPFQTVNYVPSADTVTTEKTIVRKTYRTPSASPGPYPAGNMTTAPAPVPDDASQTTTIIRTYQTQEP